MKLSLTKERLAVCQLPADMPVPAWALGDNIFSTISRTDEELSIVCPENLVPPGVRHEAGWRMFKLGGPLDFALTGILASVATPLANAGIAIFAISTFTTDYLLIKSEQADDAVIALRGAGHTVRTD